MRRLLSVLVIMLFTVQLSAAEQHTRYDILLENQRARLEAAEKNLPRYMALGWFASAGFLLSLGALVAGPVMWYQGHTSGDQTLRNAGIATTGVSALFTMPLSVRSSMFAQSGARRSVMDQQRFPGIIAATEQALVARAYGSPVLIREFRSMDSEEPGTQAVRLHLENVGDTQILEVHLRLSGGGTIVIARSLEPGERFWETVLPVPAPPADNGDAQDGQPDSEQIVRIEATQADGSVWSEDNPQVIAETLSVGEAR